MSIRSVQISNFQSHKSTKLQFDPGVNVIVGSSDSGKSAILRAMLWAIFNRPSGESFRSYWGGDTFVNIELEDKTISREKGKENLYIISSSNLDKTEIEFKAFGIGVPEEIESLLNISDINVQRQMDAPFLLNSTPGEVSRILNQAVRLDIIDRAQSNIRSALKQEKSLLISEQNTIADKQEELEKYKWLPIAEGCIAKLETIARQISQMASITIDINRVINDINTINPSLKKTSLILVYSQEVSDLINLDNSINIQTDLWNDINDIAQDIITDEKEIKLSSKLIKAESQTNEMIKIQQDYVILGRKENNLKNLIEDIVHNDKMAIAAKNNMDKRQQEFEAEMPDICVLCDQVIEKWKFIKGYEEIYEISNIGRIRTYYKDARSLGAIPKLKAQCNDKDGYKRVSLYNEKEKKPVNKNVHRLVLEAFIGNCPSETESSHLDGDKANNRLENLCWETHTDNNRRRKEHGTLPMGETHPAFGKTFSKEIKQKMSDAQKGKKHSEEHKRKNSNAQKEAWKRRKTLCEQEIK